MICNDDAVDWFAGCMGTDTVSAAWIAEVLESDSRVKPYPGDLNPGQHTERRRIHAYALSTIFALVHVRIQVNIGDIPIQH